MDPTGKFERLGISSPRVISAMIAGSPEGESEAARLSGVHPHHVGGHVDNPHPPGIVSDHSHLAADQHTAGCPACAAGREDHPLPHAVVEIMAKREHRMHHWLWHEVRNGWNRYP